MKKRHILAGLGFCFVLLLTWSLVWPPSAQAATIKVDVRVEGPEHTLVNVTDYAVNAELDYGFTTAAAAFRQVLSDANIQYQAYPTYCYFTEIDGYRETRINDVYLGWSYGLNGQPVDNKNKDVKVKDGDSLTLYYGDMRRAFPNYYLKINDDASITLIFTYAGDNANWQQVEKEPLAGATVYWDGQKYQTDAQGQVTIDTAYTAGGVHRLNVERYVPGLTLASGEPCPNVLRYAPDYTVEFINFQDLSYHRWAKDYIYNLVYLGVINGVTKSSFDPGANLTRAQLVKMLCAIEGDDIDEYRGYTVFYDVPVNQWYAPYVNWAKENNVTQGISSTEFGPDEPITRQDFVTMLYRYAQQSGVTLPDFAPTTQFIDAATISDYAIESVAAMCQAGIIQGYAEANQGYSFRPRNFTSRAEGAKMLYLFYELSKK